MALIIAVTCAFFLCSIAASAVFYRTFDSSAPAAGPGQGPPASATHHGPPGRSAALRPSAGLLGTYQIARRSLVLVEHSKTIPSPRVLHVTLRFPILPDAQKYRSGTGGLFPLLVFAPGFRQCARSYSDLLAQWAGAGYVVAAVDFPRTSCTVANPDEADLVNQPADVEYVIARVLAMSQQPGRAVDGLVNPSEIAVAGHSDGGDTVAAMAGANCCRDPQVRAVVVLAGAEWPGLTRRWFAGPTPPMMFVQGTADTWNFPAASLQLYRADLTGPRYYLDLPDADHFAPYQGDARPEPVVARVTLDFLDYYLLGQRGKLASMRQAGNVPGEAVLVSGRRQPP